MSSWSCTCSILSRSKVQAHQDPFGVREVPDDLSHGFRQLADQGRHRQNLVAAGQLAGSSAGRSTSMVYLPARCSSQIFLRFSNAAIARGVAPATYSRSSHDSEGAELCVEMLVGPPRLYGFSRWLTWVLLPFLWRILISVRASHARQFRLLAGGRDKPGLLVARERLDLFRQSGGLELQRLQLGLGERLLLLQLTPAAGDLLLLERRPGLCPAPPAPAGTSRSARSRGRHRRP